jgi:heat shock protein HslJ
MDGSPIASGATIDANFQADWSMQGNGGCNSYSASYIVQGSMISISGLSSGKALCDEPISQDESQYFTLLQQADSYTVSPGKSLQLFRGGTMVLEFKAK